MTGSYAEALAIDYREDKIRRMVNKDIVVIRDPESPLLADAADIDRRAFESQGINYSEEVYRKAVDRGMLVFGHIVDDRQLISVASAVPGRTLDSPDSTIASSRGRLIDAIYCAGDCIDKDAVSLQRFAALGGLGIGPRTKIHAELMRAREIWSKADNYMMLTGTVRYENLPILDKVLDGAFPAVRYASGREVYQQTGSTGGGFAIIGAIKGRYGPSPAGDRLLLLKSLGLGHMGDFLWRAGMQLPRTPDYIASYDLLAEEGMQAEQPQVLVQTPMEDAITPEFRHCVDNLLALGYIGVSREMVHPTREDLQYLRMVHISALPPTAHRFIQAREEALESINPRFISYWPRR